MNDFSKYVSGSMVCITGSIMPSFDNYYASANWVCEHCKSINKPAYDNCFHCGAPHR